MKTDDLIAALAADNAAVERPIAQTMLFATVLAVLAGAVVFFSMLSVRADLAAAVETPQVLFKLLASIALAIPAVLIVRKLGRPDASWEVARWSLLIAPVILAAGAAIEFAVLPPEARSAQLFGVKFWQCLALIPAIALLPLIVILYALKQGAPADPTVTGALAGLAAAGIAAALYATHCTNDSPLFVATWYSLASLAVGALGAALGRSYLRW